MPNYSTINQNISDGREASSGLGFARSTHHYQHHQHNHQHTSIMARQQRRPAMMRGSKDGGHGQASMISCIVNLLNTIIGAGTLAMPSALSHFGIVLGVVVIIWSGFTSAFGLYLQSRCARYTERGSSSFFALSQLTYPNAAVFFDAAIAIKCFGVGVSYMIIIGDLMPGVMMGFDGRAESVAFLMDRNFWITVFMLAIIPLAFLRRLDSLKYTSIIALVSIGYLIVLVVYHFAADTVPSRGMVRIFTWGGPVEALSSLPVVIFAYTCHQNMFSILNEISDNSPKSIIGVITSSIGSAAGIYILVAITGYLTFGDDILPNIVSMYAPSVASTIAKAAIVVLVTFSVPLQIHPCRASIDAVLRWRPNSLRSSATARTTSPGGRPLLPTPAASQAHATADHTPAPMPDSKFALLTTAILILSYTTALNVHSLERVLAYVGSTGSTSISFILPGLFYYKISDPNSIHHQRLTKEDDDAEASEPASDDEDHDETTAVDEAEELGLNRSVASVRSLASGTSSRVGSRVWKWRKRWRWDMEHIGNETLRTGALGLAVYGFFVMFTCLFLNLFGSVAAH